MITTSNSLCRERGAQSLGDALLHAMPDSELSRVRTELDKLRIIPTVSPHPVQPNTQSSGHGPLGGGAERRVRVEALLCALWDRPGRYKIATNRCPKN